MKKTKTLNVYRKKPTQFNPPKKIMTINTPSFRDSDWDGVPDHKDCQPFNTFKQGEKHQQINFPTEEEVEYEKKKEEYIKQKRPIKRVTKKVISKPQARPVSVRAQQLKDQLYREQRRRKDIERYLEEKEEEERTGVKRTMNPKTFYGILR